MKTGALAVALALPASAVAANMERFVQSQRGGSAVWQLTCYQNGENIIRLDGVRILKGVVTDRNACLPL